ncbi:MAG TPA: DUF4396 domain-containing protein [Planctomycetota bacterium]|nr:DUF4396 domain-containing protein [Planctomycetota bacterium]
MADLGGLRFLAEPAFVIPWYAVGALGAAFAVHDELRGPGRELPKALKQCWPIIIFFFSAIGLGLYLWASRPPLGETPKKVLASVMHCVGGDGLGIVTAMVIARLAGFDFWQEYWFEYAVGFAFGWFIFQYEAMRKMASGPLETLWMGGRAEFFSMLTVMAGMGVVMGCVTPMVAGQQPKPDTFAFWGFAALGLLAGAALTVPMNFWLVKIGWKHGQG